jgi:hypothetical protein
MLHLNTSDKHQYHWHFSITRIRRNNERYCGLEALGAFIFINELSIENINEVATG